MLEIWASRPGRWARKPANASEALSGDCAFVAQVEEIVADIGRQLQSVNPSLTPEKAQEIARIALTEEQVKRVSLGAGRS